MLHLKFALNLENLADEMIDALGKCWTDPFDSPIVIFPDPKIEQWFRLRYIAKCGVLANLEIITLDKFLFRYLTQGDSSKQKLTADILCNVLIAYLNETYSAKSKSIPKEIKKYLYKKSGENFSGEIDESKLFDFARTLAGLFLEYETSRPGGFISPLQNKHHEGLLAYWKEGELRDFFSDKGRVLPKEKWQRDVYAQLFHNAGGKSLLTRVFEATHKRTGSDTEYLTIPYLFSQQKDSSQWKKPVFIFSLSGMGQFYRVILQRFAQEHDIFAFIQNPCMEFWEDVGNRAVTRWSKKDEPSRIALPAVQDSATEEGLAQNENLLLKNWGRTGRENIRLWCLASDYTFDFVGYEYAPNSLLHQVQYLVSHRLNRFDDSEAASESISPEFDRSLTLTAAPSSLREVENLHTQVCLLLKQGVRLDEMVVIAPELDAYRTPIEQVFNAAPRDSEFYIPYAITDYPEKDSLIGKAIANLLDIHQQRSISRPAFFDLVKNPVVQSTLQITDSDVAAWEKWVVNMNVYRHTVEGSEDDWSRCINQMLFSQVTDAPFASAHERYLPYEDIESSDDGLTMKFIACIDELNRWIRFAPEGIEPHQPNSLAALKSHLAHWVALNAKEDRFAVEKKIWQRVQDAIDLMEFQFDAGAAWISWKIAGQMLSSACQDSHTGNTRLFSGGLTFMRFAVNRVVPARHIFFLGANASVFPGQKKANTMDLRTQTTRWPGDDTPVDKNCYTFLCQLMSAADGFHISYINRNLKKDEELFPSSVIRDLQFFIAESACPNSAVFRERKIPLDETRPDEELFTLRSIRNKLNRILETRTENTSENEPEEVQVALPDTVNTRDFKRFFDDPFQFQLARKVTLPSVENDPEKELFEPVSLNNLDRSILLKDFVQSVMDAERIKDSKTEEEWILKKKIPRGVFGDVALDDINKESEDIYNLVSESVGCRNAKYQEQLEVSLSEGAHSWTLRSKLDWHNELANGTHVLFSVKSGDISNTDFTKLFLDALLIAAANSNDADGIPFELRVFSSKNKVAEKKFSIDRRGAMQRLKIIYHRCYVENYRKCVPAKMYTEGDMQTFSNYRLKLAGKYGPWSYFDGKNLFDPEKFSGFSHEDFSKDWEIAVMEQTRLLDPIWRDDDE
ncbi:exodeoxyribonuclease V subunit gamma [Fibrobacter sp. UBA2449]|uniref:exodeoxyribonuclease V subunit gamma n=1 Tax=Fibrobacter sp. UBA2449 TaxID=1946529 RepID=UPI0025BA51C5|nr:exodeoxyribonuclease V subunit gamma [Fibrobacter sp. UBA2449]